MNRTEHLLTILAEECAEVAQRASKALRFGATEIQEGQKLTNAERINEELTDLLAIVSMLAEDGVLPDRIDEEVRESIKQKQMKVEHFLRYSEKCGALT